jgi:hypothetical protein
MDKIISRRTVLGIIVGGLITAPFVTYTLRRMRKNN